LALAMNRRSYDSIASQWDDARTKLSEPESRYLHALPVGLQPNAQVLDLGCGTGRPIAEHVLAAGFTVTGVDQSSALLAIARARFPACNWVESTIEGYRPVRRFAAAIAWDSLFHIPRHEHASIFHRVKSALEPDGRFMLTVGGSEHPAFTDEMFGHEFFYDSHAPEKAMGSLG
jgi:cyclopropane fatty-acyl-phospholipid synthase-like methyltransferase